MKRSADHLRAPGCEPRHARWATVVWVAILACLALLGFGLVAVTWIPRGLLRSQANLAAPDGSVATLDTWLPRILSRARLCGVLLLAAAAGLAALAKHARCLLAEVLTSASILWSSARIAAGRLVEDRLQVSVLVVIIAVGSYFRWRGLGAPLSTDEAITYIRYASKPLPLAISLYATPNNHLLNTLLVHVASQIGGDAPSVFRLPAFTAGVLLIPASYALFRAMFSKHAGLIAAALVASSYQLISYSALARGYTMAALLFILMIGLARHVDRDRSASAWLALSVVTSLALFAIPTMLFGAFVIVLYLLSTAVVREEVPLARRARDLATYVGLTTGLVFLLYLPVVVVTGPEAVLAGVPIERIAWPAFPEALLDLVLRIAEDWHRYLPIQLRVAMFVLAIVAVTRHSEISRTSADPVSLGWLAPLGVGLIVTLQRIEQRPRVFMFLLPLYLGLVAAGIVHLVRSSPLDRWARLELISPLLALALCGWFAVYTVPQEAIHTDPLRGLPRAVSFVGHNLDVDDVVIAKDRIMYPAWYYFRRADLPVGRLNADISNETDRLLFIVQEGFQTPDLLFEMTEEESPQVAAFHRPRLITRIENVGVYESRREQGESRRGR